MAKLVKMIENCSISMVRRVAALLDLDTKSFSEGDLLPIGWHFFMLAGETRTSALRLDGFPGFGVPMPDLGLPRLLLGGRTVSYLGDIRIGERVKRTSFVQKITEKTTSSGRMAIVTLQHELQPIAVSMPAIVETQTYILLHEQKVPIKSEKIEIAPIHAAYQKQVIPNEILLFQYAALGFNTHKIHWDRDYTRNVEGFPDLVVNGGLATLLLTEFMRSDLGLSITEIKVKHIAPLFCSRPMTLATDCGKTGGQFKILDDNNAIAVAIEAKIK